MHNQDLATLALHADNDVPQGSDVAPPIHLSTTFRYRNSFHEQERSGGPTVSQGIGDGCARFDSPARSLTIAL
jgi:O-acetylhomoserine/O-acetylserine sulfhydrylase-like pyridoxal-dependent enzyme